MAEYAPTSQLGALAVADSDTATGPRSSQVAALVVFSDTPIPRRTDSSQLTALVVDAESTMEGPQTSQFGSLVVYGENVIERFNQRAWTFTVDGHAYYVLHLGIRGTWIYDQSNSKWYEWKTDGYNNWNMELGWVFDGDRIIAGDNQDPIIWRVDPNVFTDQGFRYVVRKVTGAIPLRRNDTLKIFGLYVTASVGSPSADDAYIRLRFSNDNGKTWSAWFTEPLAPGSFQQVINLRSLGLAKAPGRVFEIEDAGGTVRIDGADMDTDRDE